ncbi:uncharacterized protein LOC106883218 [Octopus bimaculoides]|uniref:Uncharacterized protein n=1 Tax=Octopus bimaculoides TaxID=37653 RepID=A0A0L8FI24_OCTBM|nr:uncharacterized protein LOC106883218 [Octopus bimaculoides]|eukprot:XP_014789626.1 PREDICTED: uncharacterized protein LOC106883218 [Octopus bimaculoides]
MSDVLHRRGFLERLRKGTGNFVRKFIPCFTRQNLGDLTESETDLTPSIYSDFSSLALSSVTDDSTRNRNQSALTHEPDFTPTETILQDFDLFQRRSLEDFSSIHADTCDELFDEQIDFDDNNSNEHTTPCIPLIVRDFFKESSIHLKHFSRVIVYSADGHVTMSINLS